MRVFSSKHVSCQEVFYLKVLLHLESSCYAQRYYVHIFYSLVLSKTADFSGRQMELCGHICTVNCQLR